MSDCSLYLISPPAITLSTFTAEVDAAFSTGLVKAFQLRLKEADDAQIRAATRVIAPLARAHDVAFILNDRPDLAAEYGLDGVHLGQDDMPLREARKLVGVECVIGITCHASRHLAMEAAEAGADYVAFGAFYPTTSKPVEKLEKWGTPEPEILAIWSETMTIPSVAIGGITADNCAPLVKAGADFIAVITAVWNHPAGAAAGVKALAEAVATARLS